MGVEANIAIGVGEAHLGAAIAGLSTISALWLSANRLGGAWNDTAKIDMFVDPVNGNDASAGNTIDAPKKTLAAVTQSAGVVIGLKRGTTLAERVSLTVDGAKLVAYGSGENPCFDLSTAVAGTWTNTSGNIWSIALATAPDTVLLISSYTPTGYTKLWKYATTQTAPAAGQFGWAANTLYVFSTVDPGTLAKVGYTVNGGTIGVQLTANSNLVQDLTVLGNTTDGCFFAQDKSNSVARGCAFVGNTSDGCGGGGCTNFLVEYCKSWDNGFGARDGTGADGDGFSFHGDAAARIAIGVIRYCDIRRNRKSGFGNQLPCIVDCYGNYLYNNYWNCAVFTTTYTGALIPQHRFWNNLCVRLANDNHSWVISSAPTVPSIIRVWNCTNYSAAITANIAGFRMTETANLTVEMKNTIIFGFDRGIDVRSATVLDLDYNCLNGNTANYFDNSTGYLTGKTGAHSITTAPNFVNVANNNFRLTSSSPCIGAGAAISGIAEDFKHHPMSAPPDMGALQVAYAA